MLFSIDATLNIPDGNKFKVRSVTQSTREGKDYLECTHGSYAGLGAMVLVTNFTSIVSDGNDFIDGVASDGGGQGADGGNSGCGGCGG